MKTRDTLVCCKFYNKPKIFQLACDVVVITQNVITRNMNPKILIYLNPRTTRWKHD